MKITATLLSALFLVACGGGGGGAPAPTGPVASTDTFQLKTAYANDFANSAAYTFTLSGTVTSNGLTGTVVGNGSVTQSAVTNATFEGVAAQQKSKTVNGSITVSAAGNSSTTALPATVATNFVNSTFDLLGTTSVGAYTVAAAPTTFPVTAKVGNSGTIGTFNTYTSAAKGAIQGTTTITWSLTADTASTAIFTMSQTSKNASNAIVSTQDSVYRVTPAGGITRVSEVAVLSGVGTINYTY